MQALAAVLGGTQSLHCNGRDEALALPTEESARIALRTQQIIAAETGVANTVDPFGGAYAIEERDRPHRGGGARAARADRRGRRHAGGHRGRGDPARDPGRGLPRAAGDRRRRAAWWSGSTATRRTTDAPAIDVLQIDPEMEPRQIERRPRSVRASRDPAAWRAALDAVSAAPRRGRRSTWSAARSSPASRGRDARRSGRDLRRDAGRIFGANNEGVSGWDRVRAELRRPSPRSNT